MMKTDYRIIQYGMALSMAFMAATGTSSLGAAERTVLNEPIGENASQTKTAVTVATSDRSLLEDNVSIEAIETSDTDAVASRKRMAWLGVSTTEASETLASQLDLQAGVGLVVTYLAPEGPAAKAGLKKNDVLVEFEDQSLVHPAQLRKLVRVRNEGDSVRLQFYRSGKKQSVSVTLGQTAASAAPLEGEGDVPRQMRSLERQLKDLHIDEAVRDQMDALRQSLGSMKMDFKIDQKQLKDEIRKNMEQARGAIQEALRNVTNTDLALAPVRRALNHLAGSGLIIGNNAAVTVRSSSKGTKSLVNTDDSGTIVLLNKPKLHLTAHDPNGELVFDGEIETSAQRAKVPRDLWERVEPLLEKMGDTTAEQPEPQEGTPDRGR